MDSHVLLSLNRNTMVRHRFTPSEDEKIIQYVEKYGKCWKKIADKFGYLNGRQVRERYLLYLQPGIKNTAWDKSLDLKLLKLAEEYNHKWVKIAQFFPGKSVIHVKNQWNRIQRNNLKKLKSLNSNDGIETKENSSTNHENIIQYDIFNSTVDDPCTLSDFEKVIDDFWKEFNEFPFPCDSSTELGFKFI